MERDSWRSRLNGKANAVTSNRGSAAPNTQLSRAGSSDLTRETTSSDLVPQWGNRKRLRCMKIQAKDETTGPVQRSNLRFDRQVSRSEKDASNQQPSTSAPGIGYFNLRQRSHSLVPPLSHRFLRNCENSCAMRGQSNNGGAHDKRSPRHIKNNNNANDSNTHHAYLANKSDGGSLDRAAHDSKKGGGGSSSGGSGDATAAAAAAWPPRFMIGLTNKEKEEDFWVLKGSKLPQRPKKRAKFIQRTLNLVSPGTWLCDLTLERYEVREKKVSKKRPRGLKAMSNIESESE